MCRMPGRPLGERSFFSAKNLLERKRLGDFLEELGKLQVGAGAAKPQGGLAGWQGMRNEGV